MRGGRPHHLSPLSLWLRSGSNSTVGPARSQSMEPLEFDELTGASNRKRELSAQGCGQFVERGEMVVFARDLG